MPHQIRAVKEEVLCNNPSVMSGGRRDAFALGWLGAHGFSDIDLAMRKVMMVSRSFTIFIFFLIII